MGLLLDSFWRAVAYCLHPRVIALSFLPLVLMVALALGLGYLFWDPAVAAVRQVLDASDMLNNLWSWLQGMGAGNLKSVVAPLIIIFSVTPLIVLVSLLVVALAMTPSLTSLVAERRFPDLERKNGGSLLVGLAWSLGSTLLALVALAKTNNPYLAGEEVVRFSLGYAAWRGAMLAKRLTGQPYQISGPCHRGEAAPEVSAPAPAGGE